MGLLRSSPPDLRASYGTKTDRLSYGRVGGQLGQPGVQLGTAEGSRFLGMLHSRANQDLGPSKLRLPKSAFWHSYA